MPGSAFQSRHSAAAASTAGTVSTDAHQRASPGTPAYHRPAPTAPTRPGEADDLDRMQGSGQPPRAAEGCAHLWTITEIPRVELIAIT